MQLSQILMAIAALLCSCASSSTEAPERDAVARVSTRVDLAWNYSYSSDVALVRILALRRPEVDPANSELELARVAIVEPFKGPRVAGEEIEVFSIGAHELATPGTEHLLFLRMYEYSDEEIYSASARYVFERYLQVHNWCCPVVPKTPGSTSRDLLLYDMVNSEERGPSYRVSAEPIFRELRRLSAEQRPKQAK